MIPTPRAQMSVRTVALVSLDVCALALGWMLASNWRLGSYWGFEFRSTHQTELMIHAAVFGVAGDPVRNLRPAAAVCERDRAAQAGRRLPAARASSSC